MSIFSFCKKHSDGYKKYHCSKKCFDCALEIERVQTIWEER